MNKHFKLLFIIISTVCSSTYGQSLFRVCHNACLGLPYMELLTGKKIVELPDNNGIISIINPGDYDLPRSYFYISRIDSSGILLWNKKVEFIPQTQTIYSLSDTISITQNIIVEDISKLNQSQYVIVSLKDSSVLTTDSSGTTSFENFNSANILNIDTSGNKIWSYDISLPLHCQPQKILSDNLNIYIISALDHFYNDSALYVTKIDTAGNILWSNKYFGYSDKIIKFDATITNNILYVAQYIDDDVCITTIDSSGNVFWNNIYDTGFIDNLISIQSVYSGCILSIYRYNSSPHPIIITIDSSGAINSCKSYFSSPKSFPISLIPNGSGRFLLFEGYDTTVTPSTYLQGDLWVMDSLNNLVEHFKYNYLPSNMNLISVFYQSNNIYMMTQNSFYYSLYGWNATTPFYYRLDSIGNGCNLFSSLSDSNFITSETISTNSLIINYQSLLSDIHEENINTPDSLPIFTIDCTASVSDEISEDELGLKVFPNPFQHIINIDYFGTTRYRFELINLFSETVLSLNNLVGSNSIPTEQISKGIFIYKLIDEKGNYFTGKLIKP